MKLHSFDDLHTPSMPYCNGKPDCWCHTDSIYHDEVQHPERRNTESDVERARSFLFGRSGEIVTYRGGQRA